MEFELLDYGHRPRGETVVHPGRRVLEMQVKRAVLRPQQGGPVRGLPFFKRK